MSDQQHQEEAPLEQRDLEDGARGDYGPDCVAFAREALRCRALIVELEAEIERLEANAFERAADN